MCSAGAAPRAVVPVSIARAEASRRNGAESPRAENPVAKARSARNGTEASRPLLSPLTDQRNRGS
jgi:hypothetical protein